LLVTVLFCLPFRRLTLSIPLLIFFLFVMLLRLLTPTLFPYTTLFRSMIVNIPKDLPKDVAQEIIAKEKAYSQDLQRSGKWPHLRSEEHTSELQSRFDLVCRLLLEK